MKPLRHHVPGAGEGIAEQNYRKAWHFWPNAGFQYKMMKIIQSVSRSTLFAA